MLPGDQIPIDEIPEFAMFVVQHTMRPSYQRFCGRNWRVVCGDGIDYRTGDAIALPSGTQVIIILQLGYPLVHSVQFSEEEFREFGGEVIG